MAGKTTEAEGTTTTEEIKAPVLVEIEIEGRKVKVEEGGEVHKMYVAFKQTVNETEYSEQRKDLTVALDTAIAEVLSAFPEDVYAEMHYVNVLGNAPILFKGKDARDVKPEDYDKFYFSSRLGQAGTVQVQQRVRTPKS